MSLIVAHQAPLSLGFFRQEYCGGLPFTTPGDLHNPGIEPRSPSLQADYLLSEPPGKPLDLELNQKIPGYTLIHRFTLLLQMALVVKNPSTNAGDRGSIGHN